MIFDVFKPMRTTLCLGVDSRYYWRLVHGVHL